MNPFVETCDPVVVVPAFRRAASLIRLLNSIQQTAGDQLPRVILSLEGGASTEVKKAALDFCAEYENSDIIEHPYRLGLRRHIICCGDLALEYGAVIILEDDLMVDPYFYVYAKQALSYYEKDDSIAGIAMYAPEFNEFAGFPFRPMRSDYDTYLMRTPCSWGQLWTRKQWSKFKSWYDQSDVDELLNSAMIPSKIKQWPDSSWKKYFAAYMSLEKLDVVYPYEAFSTNCADLGGTHMESGSNLYQVALPLPTRSPPRLTFCSRESESCVSYDEYMEANGSFIHTWLGLKSEEVSIDLYGTKPASLLQRKKFTITTKRVKKFEREIAVKLRPIERNLMPPYDSDLKLSVYNIYLLNSWHLTEKNCKPSFGAYQYFSGLNLNSLAVGVFLLTRLPSLFLSKVRREIRKLFK